MGFLKRVISHVLKQPDMNHNITNLELKQNVFENRMKRQRYKIVYLTALIRERTTVP